MGLVWKADVHHMKQTLILSLYFFACATAQKIKSVAKKIMWTFKMIMNQSKYKYKICAIMAVPSPGVLFNNYLFFLICNS